MNDIPYIIDFAFHDWDFVFDGFFLEAGDEVLLEEIAFSSWLEWCY
jgi:hypothetical protein